MTKHTNDRSQALSRSAHEPTAGGPSEEAQALRDRIAQLEARLALAEVVQGNAGESVLAMEAYYRTDAQGRITFGTRAAADLLGIDYDHYLGQRLADYYVESDGRAQFLAALAAGGGRVTGYEAPMRHTDGSIVWVLTNARLLMGADGQPAGVEGVARNVTRLKETEQRLRREQGLLQHVMDTVPHWVMVKDQDARYVMVNRTMADFFRREPADFVGRTFQDVSFDTGSPVIESDRTDEELFGTGELTERRQLQVTNADGELTWRHIIKVPWRDEHGAIVGAVGISQDVTEQIRAEQRLGEQQRLLQQVMDTVPHWLFVKDLKGRYVMVNRAMAEFYGRTPADFVGAPYTQIANLQGDEVAATDAGDTEVLRTGAVVEQPSMCVYTRDGQPTWRHITRLPWRDEEGAIIGVMGISQDVTEQLHIQATLSESRHLLQTVFDTLPMWVSVKDRDLRYIMVNRQFVEDSGIPAERYIGRTAAEVPYRTKEEIAPVDAADRQVLSTGERVVLAEHALTLHDGQRLLQHFKAPYRNAQGEVQGVVTTSMDLTERLRMEARLRESEDRLSGILSMAPDAIIAVDGDQRIILFNRGAEETFGYSAEEVLQQPLEMLIPHRYHATHRHEVERFTESGTGRRYMSERNQIFGQRKDGSEFPAEASISSYGTKQGRVHTVILRDISARVRAEDIVRRSEARLKQAMLIGGLGTFEWHVDSGQVELAPEAADIFGIDHGEGEFWTGSKDEFRRFFHPEDVTSVEAHLAKVLAGEEEFALEYRIMLEGGGQRWMRAMGEVIWSNAHQAERIVGIVQDVSEARELEEHLRHSQKIEAVGNLAGGIAHDFNNMLQIIRGYVELGVKRADEPKLRGYLEHVLSAADSAAQLTRQLLAFSRREVLRMRPVDLNRLVAEHADMLRRVIQEDIELTVSPHPSPLMVVADTGMLQQVIINLCVNARDAMSQGGVIRIVLGRVVPDEAFRRANDWARHVAYATLSVIDNGPGMPAHVRDRVFEPYFTTKEATKGTGLGLSMAYGILRQHEGSVEVESAPGQGATFTLYLPEAVHEAVDQRSITQPAVTQGRGRILVAEDEPGVRKLAVSMLEAGGYDVVQAADGAEALERVRVAEAPPDLVVLDMVMPKLGGRQAYEALRHDGFRMPVIFATGYEGSDGDFEFVQAERVPVLRKPYSADDLLGLVGRLLGDWDD